MKSHEEVSSQTKITTKNQRKRKENRGFHFTCPKVTENKNSFQNLKLNTDELKENNMFSLTRKSLQAEYYSQVIEINKTKNFS